MTALPHLVLGSPEYSPLPSYGSFIRLLDILPGNFDAILECNLRVASLRSQLSYKAVSYAWIDDAIGPQTESAKSIVCDGKPILISTNLHSALRVFRSTTSILTLWVDFLCINQQDTQERNQQVGMMRSIYSNSLEVLIWLGPNMTGDHLGNDRIASSSKTLDRKVVWHHDSRDDHMVYSYMERFHDYEHPQEIYSKTIEYVPYEYGRLESASTANAAPRIPWSRDVFGAFCMLKKLAQGTFSKDLRFYKANMTSTKQIYWSSLVRQGIAAIVDSSWWQRTWVIQETVLPRKATVYLGNISAPWTMLAEAAATYIHELGTSDLTVRDFDDRDVLSTLANIVLDLESVRIARIDEVRLPLLSLLRRFRSKKSSDPRDKVFALLGLAREHIQSSLKPDYNLSRDQIMLQSTIATISESRDLESLAGHIAGPMYLHSWMTNWSQLPAGHERERLDCHRLYNASGGNPGIAYLHGEGILEIRGYFVGEIEFIGREAPDSGFDRLRSSVKDWQWTCNDRYFVQIIRDDSFWRTVTADTLYVGSAHPSSWVQQDIKYRRATSEGSAAFNAWKTDNTIQRNRKTSYAPGGLVKNYVEPEELTALKNGFHFAVRTASSSRKFFAIKDGPIGIGPAEVFQGDAVFIVLGSRVPLIMRRRTQPRQCSQAPVKNLFGYPGGDEVSTGVCGLRHDDVYALVGDAYVHGVMDGEFVRNTNGLQPIFVQ